MSFLIWVNHLFLALKMTFCYRICCFCGNNLYISFFSLCYVCNKIGCVSHEVNFPFYSSLSSPLPSCPASPLLSPLGLEPVPWLVPPLCSVLPPAGVPPLGLEPPPSEPSPGVVGVLMSTLALPSLMALMTAA